MIRSLTIVFCILFWLSAAGKEFADKVIVYKSERRLELVVRDSVIFSCKVALGFNPKGHKIREGDGRTPEGEYILDYRNSYSHFYKSFHISYPNDSDIAIAARKKVKPGNFIMLHGLKNGYGWMGKSHLANDWTNGCIAVTNQEMDIIWERVKDGTPIEIRK